MVEAFAAGRFAWWHSLRRILTRHKCRNENYLGFSRSGSVKIIDDTPSGNRVIRFGDQFHHRPCADEAVGAWRSHFTECTAFE